MNENGFDYNKRRYWYHISTNDFGNNAIIDPNTEGHNRCYGEPKVARFCVAPTIQQCIAAVPLEIDDFDDFEYPFVFRRNSLYVYQSFGKRTAKYPYSRKKDIEEGNDHLPFDRHITHEGWITQTCRFKKIGVIGADINEETFLNIDFESCTEGDPAKIRRHLNRIRKNDHIYFYSISGQKVKLKDFNHGIDGGIKAIKTEKSENLVLTPA